MAVAASQPGLNNQGQAHKLQPPCSTASCCEEARWARLEELMGWPWEISRASCLRHGLRRDCRGGGGKGMGEERGVSGLREKREKEAYVLYIGQAA
jgi:hypothetical protein